MIMVITLKKPIVAGYMPAYLNQELQPILEARRMEA